MEGIGELTAWLVAQGVEVDLWGRNGAKTVADLWQEVRKGDCKLQQLPAARLIQLVEVIIQQDHRVLLELEQVLNDGTRRRRLIPPSEKMRPGESPVATARRGLYEELHLAPDSVQIDSKSFRQRQRWLSSPSYPGLMTRYTIYSLRAAVTGLPERDFWLDNLAFGDGDPVRKQQWGWRVRPGSYPGGG